MKLFKNKVGRPSKEVLNNRKIFVVSAATIILSIITIILSSVLLNNVSINKIKGATANNIKFSVTKPSKGKSVFPYIFDIYKFDKEDKYDVKITVTNENSNDAVYFRWFTYDANGSRSWNSKKNGEFTNSDYCSKQIKGGSLSIVRDMEVGPDEYKERTGILKIYDDKESCKNDDSGEGKSLAKKEVVYKYSGSDTDSDVTTKDEDYVGAIEILRSFFQWFFGLFKDIDKPSTGSGEVDTQNNTFTVVFEGYPEGTMEPQIIEYGVSTALSKNKFVGCSENNMVGVWGATKKDKNGIEYHYGKNNGELDWYKIDEGSNYYFKDQQKISTLVEPGETVYMKEICTDNAFYVDFCSDSECPITGISQKILMDTPTTLRKNDLKKEGYKFIGWIASVLNSDERRILNYGYDDNNKLGWHNYEDINEYYLFKDEEKIENLAEVMDQVHMHVQWIPEEPQFTKPLDPGNDTFKVVYVGENSQYTMNPQIIKHGKSVTLSKNEYKAPEGSVFSAWFAYKYNEGTKYVYGYNWNNELGWYDEKDIKESYSFKDQAKISNLVDPGEIVYMEVTWAINEFYVYFCSDSVCSESEHAIQNIKMDTPTALLKNNFKKEGYKFIGWRAQRYNYITGGQDYYGYDENNKLGWHDSNDIKKYYLYKDQEVVENMYDVSETIYMTAQWERIN